MNIISIPFLVRGLFTALELIIHINEKLGTSIVDDTWLAPIVYLIYIIIVDITPIASQLSSMLVVIDENDEYSTENVVKYSDGKE